MDKSNKSLFSNIIKYLPKNESQNEAAYFKDEDKDYTEQLNQDYDIYSLPKPKAVNTFSSENSEHQKKFLTTVQDKVRNASMYQKGGGGNYKMYTDNKSDTWCNQSGYDVMDSTGWNLKPLFNGKSQYNVNATDFTKSLQKAAKDPKSSYVEVSPSIAQDLANEGVTVTSILDGSNHISTVRPSSKKYDPKLGPLISNVGEVNKIMYVSDSQGYGMNNWTSGKIHFYVDTNQLNEFKTSNLAKNMTK